MMRQICVRFASDNYDRWVELYWKKQLEGNLTEEEQKELEEPEKENMKTVEKVYKSFIKRGCVSTIASGGRMEVIVMRSIF